LRGQLQAALRQKPESSGLDRSASARPGLKPASGGTGFYVSDDVILTNNHVVDGCAEVRVRKRGVQIGTAIQIAANRSDDLAALKAPTMSDKFLRLRIGIPVKPAEMVLVFGYPLSFALSSSGNTTLGNVTALSGLRDDSRFIQISASIQPGNSGGPVVDSAGRLLGVVEGKLDAIRVARLTGDIPQNVNFAIRTTTVVNFLEFNRLTYEIASSGNTLSTTEVAEIAEAASVQLECWK
jgi:S1-C subfamily serine protease